MVEDGNGDRLITELAAEIAPAAACAPSGISFFPFAGQVAPIDAGVFDLGDRSRPAACIGEDFGLVGGSLQGVSDAHAENTFFIVIEDDFFAESLQGRDPVDAAEIRAAAEHETRVLLQNELLLSGDPVRVYFQFSLIVSALCQRNGAVANAAHFGSVLRLDGSRVVPEIETIDISIVEPQAGVMRMIHALARSRLEWEAARDDRALRSAEWKEDRLCHPFGPNVGGKRLGVDYNVDSALGFIGNYSDSFRG